MTKEFKIVADAIVRFPTGMLRVSRIVYFTDLQHADSRELPIGVTAEVTLPTLHAIGTALRPGFHDSELALMGPTMRDLLRRPMDFLWPQMLEALNVSAPGRALEALGEKFHTSLSVFAPATVDFPRQWLLAPQDEKLWPLVDARLRILMEDEYYKFLFPPRDGIDQPTVDARQAA